MNKLVNVLFLVLLVTGSKAQDTIFREPFDAPSIPVGWADSVIYTKPGTTGFVWRFQTGGHDGNPDTAAIGVRNACLFLESPNADTNMLISPPIDLTGKTKPKLTFWHIQQTWNFGGSDSYDRLTLWYRKSSSSPWYELPLGNFTYSSVEEWSHRSILLPDSAISPTFQLGFVGIIGYGHGVCIDEVIIHESDLQTRYLVSEKYSQASTLYMANGSKNNLLLRLDFKIEGNTGSPVLETLRLTSKCSNPADIQTNGIKLYATPDTIFGNYQLITPGKSIVGGYVDFTAINYVFQTGKTSLWVTADIAETAEEDNLVDFSLDAGSILLNDTLYPTVPHDPPGERVIQPTVFYDDFETDKGWIFTGEFERNRPRGLGGVLGDNKSGGVADPQQAFSGDTVIGVDLTGNPLLGYDTSAYQSVYFRSDSIFGVTATDTLFLGMKRIKAGNYELGIANRAYTAVSPVFNCYYFKDLQLNFKRHLNVYLFDRAFIDLSLDGGSTWQQIWSNNNEGGYVTDSRWKDFSLNISDYASRERKVSLRFAQGSSGYLNSHSGWNIDDLFVTGNLLQADCGITELISPVPDCSMSDAETVTIKVANFASKPTSERIPVSYSFDGLNVVYDTIIGIIDTGEVRTFSFSEKVDLSNAAYYPSARFSVNLPGDEAADNDAMVTEFYSLPTITGKYSQTFEFGKGLWYKDTSALNSWDCKIPSTQIGTPPSPTRAWFTGSTTNYYNNGEVSSVISPCFDFTDGLKRIFETRYWVYAEDSVDGACVEYTFDNGVSWSLLHKDTFSFGWDWYNNQEVSALGHEGWSAYDGTWRTARVVLPDTFIGRPDVKFRFKFAANIESPFQGFAFDNVVIRPAPLDVGVTGLGTLASACQSTQSPYLTVDIKNYGINPLVPTDTILLNITMNGTTTITDTFRLNTTVPVDGTFQHTMTKPLNYTAIGDYTFVAKTLGESVPSIYGTNNDSYSQTITIHQNPITNLPDTLGSLRPDTFVLVPHYDASYAYSWTGGSTGSTFAVPTAGTWRLTVTDNDPPHCQTIDSTVVLQLNRDIGIAGITFPKDTCAQGTAESIEALFGNFGTDTIRQNESFQVGYIFNNGTLQSQFITIPQRLAPGESVPFVFTGTINLSVPGTFPLKVFTIMVGDTVPGNDTTSGDFEMYPYPVVNLGDNLVVQALSHTLDAGAGMASYAWSNGGTSRTTTISEPGGYGVTVTNGYGCPADDSVYVFLKIRDIAPDSLLSPLKTCSNRASEGVSIQVRNTGTDTIPAMTELVVSYQLDSQPVETDTIYPPDALLPGQVIEHSFAQTIGVLGGGVHVCQLMATSVGDLRLANNNLPVNIETALPPQVVLDTAAIVTIPGRTKLLDAGYGENYTYLWQNGSVNQTFLANRNGNYRVLVTDTVTTCVGGDTVFLVFVFSDLTIVAASPIDEVCTGPQTFQVEIENSGATDISAAIPFGVELMNNDVSFGVQNLTFTTQLLIGGRVWKSLSLPVNYLTAGVQDTKFILHFSSDNDAANDTFSIKPEAIQGPIVELNGGDPDMYTTTLPIILDAGAGFDSYLWQNGATTRTYTAMAEGPYWVTVTNTTGCTGRDSVYLRIKTTLLTSTIGDSFLEVYPQPASENLFVQFNTYLSAEKTRIELVDMDGRVVYHNLRYVTDGVTETIPVNHLGSGVYLLRLSAPEFHQVLRVAIHQ